MKKILLFILFAGLFTACKYGIDPLKNASQTSLNAKTEGKLGGRSVAWSRIQVEELGLKQYRNVTNAKRKEADEYPLLVDNPDKAKPLYICKRPLLHDKADINNLNFDNDWRIPHQKIQANHAKLSEKYWIPYEEQYSAYMMLENYLFKQKITAEVQEAIGIYTEWLLKNNSIEIGVMRVSLNRLNGYWDKKKMKDAEKKLVMLTHKISVEFPAYRKKLLAGRTVRQAWEDLQKKSK